MRASTRRWASRRLAASPAYIADEVAAWEKRVEEAEWEAAHLWPTWTPPNDGEMHELPFIPPDEARERRREFNTYALVRQQMLETWGWWGQHWPLPIGRAAFLREQRAFKGCRSEAILPVLAALPYDGDQEALLAFEARLPDSTALHIFALGRREEEPGGQYAYHVGQAAFLPIGPSASRATVALADEATAWLRGFNGRPVKAPGLVGRKARVIAGLDRQDSLERFREILRMERSGKSQSQIAARFGEPKSTVHGWLMMAREAEANGTLN